VAVGQEITGNIAGTVTDVSGAAVPNATVTVKNINTNVVKTYKTDGEGRYVATLLPIGIYSVAVDAKGFSKYLKTNIELNVNERVTVSPQLKVGTSDQVVEVQAEAEQVDTQSAAAVGLVNGTQVRELSLNNRNYEQLLTLVPGVTSTASDQIYVGATNPLGTNTVNFSVNGARTSQNNWMVDGADNIDRGSNLTLLSYPSVDAIAEFKLVRGAYDPEFGRNGGGQVNVVTRSGTSAFHGSAYEFFRNDVLNANTYLNKNKAVATPRNPLRYNDFGWTFGGPIYIPGHYNTQKNKTFFFFSQEFRRIITYTSQLATVPTAAERTGVFAHPVCTTWSGTTCTATGNTINPANFSPTASAYLKDIYAGIPVSDPTTHQFLSQYSAVNNFREEMLKIDQNFGSKLTLTGKLLWDSIPSIEPGGLFTNTPIPGIAGTSTNSPGHNFTIRGTYTITPTLLLEAGYGYSYGAITSDLTNGTISSAVSKDITPTLPFTSTLARVPTVTMTSLSSLTGFGPYRDYNRNNTVFSNVSWIKGRNSFKFGFTYYHYQKTENAGGNNAGTFAFNTSGQPTGTLAVEQSWANFLTGHVSSFTQDQYDLSPNINDNQFEFYGQDQLRLRPNLTVTLGARWSFFRQPTDANGQLTNFLPSAYNPAKAPCFAADGTINLGAACNANWDPLNGIIIGGKNSPFGNKVGSEDNGAIAPRIGIAWDPFSTGKTSIRAGYGIFYDTSLFGTAEQNIFTNPPFVNSTNIPNTNFTNPGGSAAAVNASPKRIYGRIPYDLQVPYNQQWSLDLQQEIVPSLLFDIGYYGGGGRHLIGILDLNQPAAGAYKTQVAQCSTTVTTNCVPAAGFITTSNISLINPIRPYKGYTGIDGIEPWFNSNYNSLQVQLQKKFKGNSMVNLAYTWSHALTNNQTDRSTPPQNSYDFAGDYGPMQQDRRNVLTANFVYNLPWYESQKGFTGHLLGGWEMSGIITAQSGVPLTIGTASGTNDFAGQGCRGPSPCAVRPDQISDPNAGAQHTFLSWFNTAAFANPAAGQYRPGNSRRGTILGPGLWRVDFSVFKNIKITERLNTQFRAEMFNVFNHTNFDGVNTTTTSATYGQITSTRDPRQVQLALKLTF